MFFVTDITHSLSFGGPQLYNSQALPFTYDQYVVIESADKLCYCLFLCESMNLNPDKQLFPVASTGVQTTDSWITKPVLYLYTMGDPLPFRIYSHTAKPAHTLYSLSKKYEDNVS